MRTALHSCGLLLAAWLWLSGSPTLAQDGIRRISIPENSELTAQLDQTKVSARIGRLRRIHSLKFLVETEGQLKEPDTNLEFGKPFFVELVFTQAAMPKTFDVMVTLGDGRTLKVPVMRQPETPERYLSKPLTLNRQGDQ